MTSTFVFETQYVSDLVALLAGICDGPPYLFTEEAGRLLKVLQPIEAILHVFETGDRVVMTCETGKNMIVPKGARAVVHSFRSDPDKPIVVHLELPFMDDYGVTWSRKDGVPFVDYYVSGSEIRKENES